jgi:salicylate hydroxylase
MFSYNVILEYVRLLDANWSPLNRAALEVKMWELKDIDPLPTWVRGKAILIGDAAHAMTPMQGQGANQSIEDADGLQLLSDPGVSREMVPAILKKIDSLRRPRVKQVQLNTRLANEEIPMEERMARMDYNYRYDGIHSVEKAQKV